MSIISDSFRLAAVGRKLATDGRKLATVGMKLVADASTVVVCGRRGVGTSAAPLDSPPVEVVAVDNAVGIHRHLVLLPILRC